MFELKLFAGTEQTYAPDCRPTGGVVQSDPNGVTVQGDRVYLGPEECSGSFINDPEKIATSREAALQILGRRESPSSSTASERPFTRRVSATGIVIVWASDANASCLPDVAYTYTMTEELAKEA